MAEGGVCFRKLISPLAEVAVSNGSGLPGNQRYPAGSGTGSNRTAVPFYGSYISGSN